MGNDGQRIGGLSSYELEFTEGGSLVRDTGLRGAVTTGEFDDVFVFSHGWNNGTDSARRLYGTMFDLLGAGLARHAPDKTARTAVVGIFWPSLLFPEDDPTTGRPASAPRSSGAELATALKPAFPGNEDNLARIGELLDGKGGSDQLVEFHERAKRLVTTPNLDAGEDSGERAAVELPTGAVITYYSGWPHADGRAAEGLLDPVEGLWDGAREVLRTLSYYEMKNRAGQVGRVGLGPFLSTVAAPDGHRPRVHLLGHSFGARLVAYALSGLADGLVGAASPIKSLLLIQGAFSHFSFNDRLSFDPDRGGALAGYSNRVDGPLLSTFTRHDRAVGWWYPLASMLKRQDASSQADLLYRWGAMGADGYQVDGTSRVPLGDDGFPYGFASGRFYRLDANSVIDAVQSPFTGAHSDICHPEVAWAAIAAAGLANGR
ncbi:serine/threonine protein kinase [Planosporangium flavigriseum]|uniref:Uncharacterized protein n=1 Tax=Planosporangium flavigriseum TaxID=373681 RepID=A0A8J3LYC1_9ACTN|nr:serine/threonine protein kinase [Planosporangium flavigriseum]NJC67753.1 serine/threonine protein kinase [Planosporangium flavigriseum]GIG76029.1 hypothetical protein Pfl04_44330 [Planosporangium flavigriseum]